MTSVEYSVEATPEQSSVASSVMVTSVVYQPLRPSGVAGASAATLAGAVVSGAASAVVTLPAETLAVQV